MRSSWQVNAPSCMHASGASLYFCKPTLMDWISGKVLTLNLLPCSTSYKGLSRSINGKRLQIGPGSDSSELAQERMVSLVQELSRSSFKQDSKLLQVNEQFQEYSLIASPHFWKGAWKLLPVLVKD